MEITVKKRLHPNLHVRVSPEVMEKLDFLCTHVGYGKKKVSRATIVTRLIENASKRHQKLLESLR